MVAGELPTPLTVNSEIPRLSSRFRGPTRRAPSASMTTVDSRSY